MQRELQLFRDERVRVFLPIIRTVSCSDTQWQSSAKSVQIPPRTRTRTHACPSAILMTVSRHRTWRCAESNDTVIRRAETMVRDDFRNDHLGLSLAVRRIYRGRPTKRTEVITAFKTHPGSARRTRGAKQHEALPDFAL